MFAAALILLLSLFAVSGSAHTADISLKENTFSYHTVNVYQGSGTDTASLRRWNERLDAVVPAETVDADEVEEDGINTRIASVWIICVSAVFIAGILTFVILLAKKNKTPKADSE